ncbi:MAG: hypothetical protein ACI977_000288 [Candidatus Nanohaloarchaea archaeon]
MKYDRKNYLPLYLFFPFTVNEERFVEFSSDRDEKPSEEDIGTFQEDFENTIILSDQFLTILAVTGARESVQIEGYFRDEDELEEFGDFVNRFGVNCYVDRGLDKEETALHTLSALIDQDDSKIDRMLENSPLVATLYLSRSHSLNEVKEIARAGEEEKDSDYHRKFGEFLEYPDRDIDAFIYSQKPGWKKKLMKILGRDSLNPIHLDKAAAKYSKDLSERDKRILNSFTDRKIADTEESFKRTMQAARDRFETVDRYTDAEKLMNEILY